MKFKIFASAILLSITLSVSAQERTEKGNRENRQQPSEQTIKELGLSDKQVTEWKEIQEKNRKNMQEQRQNNKEADKTINEERRKKMEEMRKSHREDIQKILTKDQYVKYLEMEKDKADKGAKKGKKSRK